MAKIPAKFQHVFDKHKGTYPVPLVEIARELDIDVFMSDDLEDSESGLIRRGGEGFEVFLNVNQPATSRSFTLAHEIAHRMLHDDKLDQGQEHVDGVAQYVGVLHNGDTTGMSPEDLQLEQDANEVAAEILMPKEAFTAAWTKFAVSEGVARVAREFGVSERAAAVRGAELLGYVIP